MHGYGLNLNSISILKKKVIHHEPVILCSCLLKFLSDSHHKWNCGSHADISKSTKKRSHESFTSTSYLVMMEGIPPLSMAIYAYIHADFHGYPMAFGPNFHSDFSLWRLRWPVSQGCQGHSPMLPASFATTALGQGSHILPRMPAWFWKLRCKIPFPLETWLLSMSRTPITMYEMQDASGTSGLAYWYQFWYVFLLCREKNPPARPNPSHSQLLTLLLRLFVITTNSPTSW